MGKKKLGALFIAIYIILTVAVSVAAYFTGEFSLFMVVWALEIKIVTTFLFLMVCSSMKSGVKKLTHHVVDSG